MGIVDLRPDCENVGMPLLIPAIVVVLILAWNYNRKANTIVPRFDRWINATMDYGG